MTDNTGLFQFATLTVHNKELGCTLDDNARVLIVCSWLTEQKNTWKIQGLINTYFAFMKKCQRKDGSFVNYIGYSDKLPTDQNNREDLEDTQSRAFGY